MVRQTTDSDPTVLIIRRRYPAPRERVFEAWTNAQHLQAWFRPSDEVRVVTAEVEPREGGVYKIAFRVPDKEALQVVSGVYREFAPPERLVFTWTWEAPSDHAGIETLVTIELCEVDGQTDLVLTHERFPAQEMRDSHQWGWTGVVDNLTAHLASGA